MKPPNARPESEPRFLAVGVHPKSFQPPVEREGLTEEAIVGMALGSRESGGMALDFYSPGS